MILDSLKNAKSYISISKNMKTAFEFLQKTDFSKFPLGKTEIDGKEVFINFMEYTTKDIPADFEAHKNYIDIQFIVSGNERIDYAPIGDCKVTKEYSAEKDYLGIATDKFIKLSVKAGDFAVFFPQDAHRPSLTDDKSCNVVKGVVKVKI